HVPRRMADQGLKTLAIALAVSVAACGDGGNQGAHPALPLASSAASSSSASASPESGAPRFPDEPKLLHFHSKRFALSLPLPDGRAWRIDDHSHVELVATHAP